MDGRAAPEARYERREGVELAFVAALQHLPPNQRAALILREVLGFSGQEIAEALETTVAAVNSALQRARKAVDERLPDRSQQATLRALGDQRLREVVEGYMDAMARGDVDAVVSLLAQDAVWSMPPLGAWYRGRRRDRRLPGHRAAQRRTGTGATCPRAPAARPRSAPTSPTRRTAPIVAFALDVLTLRGDRIADITSFINRTTQLRDGDDFLRWPALPGGPGAGCSRTSRPSACPTGWTERARGGRRAGEARARAAHERLRAADRDVQPPGDRLVRVAAELVGDERDALALGQALELADEVAQVVGAHDLLVRVGAGVAQHRARGPRGRSCAPGGAGRRACGCARW